MSGTMDEIVERALLMAIDVAVTIQRWETMEATERAAARAYNEQLERFLNLEKARGELQRAHVILISLKNTAEDLIKEDPDRWSEETLKLYTNILRAFPKYLLRELSQSV